MRKKINEQVRWPEKWTYQFKPSDKVRILPGKMKKSTSMFYVPIVPEVYRSVTLEFKLPSLQTVKKICIQLDNDSWHTFVSDDWVGKIERTVTGFIVEPEPTEPEPTEPEPTQKRKFRKPMEE